MHKELVLLKIKSHKLQALVCLFLLFILSACVEEGLNQGTNSLVLNGSVLKGQLIKAEVRIIDDHDVVYWKSTTDGNGGFVAELELKAESVYSVISTTNPSSSMVCDAKTCVDATTIVACFGETVTVGLGKEVRLASLFYSTGNTVDTQLNTFTTLVFDIIKKELPKKIHQGEFDDLAKTSSKIIANALGLTFPDNVNLLKNKVININVQDDLKDVGELTTMLTLINASLAYDITRVSLLSTSIVALINDPNNSKNLSQLEELKSSILTQTIDLLGSGYVEGVNSKAEENITTAKWDSIDLDAFKESVVAYQESVAAAQPGTGSGG